MEPQPSVWRIALGAMLGNIGCLIANVLLFACMMVLFLTVLGGSMAPLLRNLPRPTP